MTHFDIGNRLSIYGWKLDEEDFFFLMAKIWWCKGFSDRYRNVEQMLFHPSGGTLPFVQAVRLESGLNMPEEEILQTLSNLRKNKYLESVKHDCKESTF
jgi:hypothetical protein